jgi:ribosomal protein L20A (L18A)
MVHTLDISAKHSAHARTIVKNFRHGIYYNSVNFNVGDLPDFFSTHNSSLTQFLSHVILDMPSAETRIPLVSKHMRVDGKLLVFNPSVTQIAECVQIIKDLRLPLILEHVLELGGGQSGAREWDVRIAKIRSVEKEAAQKTASAAEVTEPGFWRSIIERVWSSQAPQVTPEKSTPPKDWAVVCRPKYTDRIVGGGFLGVWRRMRDQ